MVCDGRRKSEDLRAGISIFRFGLVDILESSCFWQVHAEYFILFP